MQTEFIVIIALAACALAAALGAFITALVSRFKQKGGGAEGALSHDDFVDIIDDVKRELKEKTEEQGKITRENASSSATAQTQALGAYMKNITDIADTTRRAVGENFEKLTSSLNDTVRVMGEKTEQRLNALDENVRKSLEKVREDNEKQLEKVRTDNAAQLEKVRTDNALQLEKMRETVDEKLSKTLETRLGESFKTVQQSLDNVSKGLGEMRQLGEQVGNMNRLLGGVKTRGNWGEVALESLLEDILAPEQFERQCQVKRGSGERVDFAVRMPGSEGKEVLLPIDSKFPAEDYLRYADAANAGDSAAAELYLKFFKESVMKQGRSIKAPYDRLASPTYVKDLAVLLLEMAQSEKYGVYHGVNEGYCSLYEMALEIKRLCGYAVSVLPVKGASIASREAEPTRCVLDTSCLDGKFRHLPPWKDALMRYLEDEGELL